MTADPIRPTTVDLREPGEPPRELRYTFRSFEYMDQHLAGDRASNSLLMLQYFAAGGQFMSMTHLRVILAAGLIWQAEDYATDPDQTRTLIEAAVERGVFLDDIKDAVSKAVTASQLMRTRPPEADGDAAAGSRKPSKAGSQPPKPPRLATSA